MLALKLNISMQMLKKKNPEVFDSDKVSRIITSWKFEIIGVAVPELGKVLSSEEIP